MMKNYNMTGVIDGWKIIRETVKARTDKEAKSRLRRRYSKIQSILISSIETPDSNTCTR